ncbi:MAG: hypothetical protein NTV07_01715 [Candidatus Omnitrophica bacterium]|nr:hypothetical protein [Candidatus Omnitrophota bacterium]
MKKKITIFIIILSLLTPATAPAAPGLYLRPLSLTDRPAVELEANVKEARPAARPMNRFEGWLIRQRCSRLARKAGLMEGTREFDLAVRLGMIMHVKGMYLPRTYLEGIPALLNTQRRSGNLILMLKLGIELAARGTDPSWTFIDAIPAISKTVKTPEELNKFLEFDLRLVRQGLGVYYPYKCGVPAIMSVAKNEREVDMLLAMLEEAATALSIQNIFPMFTYEAMPAMAKAAGNADKLKSLFR